MPAMRLFSVMLLAALSAACERTSSSSSPAAGAQAAQAQPAAASAEPASPAAFAVSAPDVEPDLVVAYTASVQGFLQPCGCAVQGGEMGGIARRATLLDSLQSAGAPVLLLEAGDFVGGAEGTGPQIAEASLAAMKTLGYDAVAIGEAELALGAGFLAKLAGSGIPLAHANWSHPAVGPAQSEGLMLEVGGRKVGIVGLLDPQALPPGFGLESLVVEDPEPAARAAAASLREAGAEVVLVLGHASFRRSGLMGASAGRPDLWIVGHGGKELAEPTEHDGVLLLGPGNAGKMVGLLELDLDGAPTPRYAHRLHPLPESMPERPDMAELVKGLTPPAHWGT